MFADLCGFTEYTRRFGDAPAAALATEFHRRVRELAAALGCDVVKSIGDAVMLHADDCRVAVRLARRVIKLGESDGHPPIRVGLDRGPAVQLDGDWYGGAVNVAAHLTDAATAGELLLTDRARRAISDSATTELVAIAAREVKGAPRLAIHAVVPT
jgi:adenylate cyclase